MGYFFAILSPFLDSTINYLDKYLLSKFSVNPTVLAIYSGIFAFATGIIIMLLLGLHPASLQTILIILSSGFLSVFILVTYFKALNYDEASRVASLFQIVPVFVIILSFIFLKEALALKQYIGSAFIIIAGFLFAVRKLESGLFHVNKAFWYMMLSCFIVAASTVLFKLGADDIGFWQAVPYEGLGNGIAAVLIAFTGNNYRLLLKAEKRTPRRVFLYLLLSELIYRVSRYSFYFALVLLPASIVSLLQGFQSVFLIIEAIILSLWFPHIIREVITKKTVGVKLIAVLAVFIGLYLIFIP